MKSKNIECYIWCVIDAALTKIKLFHGEYLFDGLKNLNKV